jgi:hypothetical protein
MKKKKSSYLRYFFFFFFFIFYLFAEETLVNSLARIVLEETSPAQPRRNKTKEISATTVYYKTCATSRNETKKRTDFNLKPAGLHPTTF